MFGAAEEGYVFWLLCGAGFMSRGLLFLLALGFFGRFLVDSFGCLFLFLGGPQGWLWCFEIGERTRICGVVWCCRWRVGLLMMEGDAAGGRWVQGDQ